MKPRDRVTALMQATDLELSAPQIMAICGLWAVNVGTVYVALTNLERKGAIASRFIDGPTPRTRVYRRTARGNP